MLQDLLMDLETSSGKGRHLPSPPPTPVTKKMPFPVLAVEVKSIPKVRHCQTPTSPMPRQSFDNIRQRTAEKILEPIPRRQDRQRQISRGKCNSSQDYNGRIKETVSSKSISQTITLDDFMECEMIQMMQLIQRL